MDGNPDEKFVAYHGVGAPNMHQVIPNVMTDGLFPGDGQQRRNDECKRTGLKV